MQLSVIIKIFSILVYIVDVFADYQTGATYWNDGDVWWGSLTIAIALIHSFISTIYLLWTIHHNSSKYPLIWSAGHLLRRVLTVVICCSGFGPVLITIDTLVDFRRKKVDPFKEGISDKLAILALIEAIPQSCLQSYILTQKTLSPPSVCKPMKLGFAKIHDGDNGTEFLQQMSMIVKEVSSFPSSGGCITFDNIDTNTITYHETVQHEMNIEDCKDACLKHEKCDVFSHVRTECQLMKIKPTFQTYNVIGRHVGQKLGKCFETNNVTYRDIFHGVVVTGQQYNSNGVRLFVDSDENICLLQFNEKLELAAPKYFLHFEGSQLSLCYMIKERLLHLFTGLEPMINMLPLVNMLTSIFSASFIVATKIHAPAFVVIHGKMMETLVVKVSSIVVGFVSMSMGLLHVLTWFGLIAVIDLAVALGCLPILLLRMFNPAVCRGKVKPFAGWSLQLVLISVIWYLAMNPEMVYSQRKSCDQIMQNYNVTARDYFEKWHYKEWSRRNVGWLLKKIQSMIPEAISDKLYEDWFDSTANRGDDPVLKPILGPLRNSSEKLILSLHGKYGVSNFQRSNPSLEAHMFVLRPKSESCLN